MIKKTLCFSNPAYLSLQNAQLAIRLPEVETCDDLPDSFKKQSERTIPIEDIGVVLLDNKRITITSSALEALIENNCAVITCDSKNMPIGLLLPLCGKQKISNQAKLLSIYTNTDVGCMYVWADKVRSGDPENLEARAAAYYWKNLFSDIPDFVRGREGEPPNNLLNYGYAILRAVVARSLVASGLLPTLGIHHHNRYNAYCLADDIMEPYRPYVDGLVLDVMASTTDYSELTKEIKMKLLAIPVLDTTIGNKKSPLMIATQQTTSSLYKCFSGEQRRMVYPEL